MSRQPRIYTRTGDDGTTGLLFGGRTSKTDARIVANGDIDEAQAAIGVARAAAHAIDDGGELHQLLTGVARDLWRLMGEVAVAQENREKLGESGVVTQDMVDGLEHAIDELKARFAMPTEFVVPGANPVAAALDVARTVVRRAERSAVAVAGAGSLAPVYLNRLSDLLWAAARAHEGAAETARPPEDQS